MDIEGQMQRREMALQEKARALSGASLARARDGESLCYIERFGRLPYRVIAEAFERYAEELQRVADSAVAAFALTPAVPEVEAVEEEKPVRRRRAKGPAEDEPAV